MCGQNFTAERKLLPLSCSQSVNVACAVVGDQCVRAEVYTGVCPACRGTVFESTAQPGSEVESVVSFPDVSAPQWETIFGLQEGTPFSEGTSSLDLETSAEFVLGRDKLQLGAEVSE